MAETDTIQDDYVPETTMAEKTDAQRDELLIRLDVKVDLLLGQMTEVRESYKNMSARLLAVELSKLDKEVADARFGELEKSKDNALGALKILYIMVIPMAIFILFNTFVQNKSALTKEDLTQALSTYEKP